MMGKVFPCGRARSRPTPSSGETPQRPLSSEPEGDISTPSSGEGLDAAIPRAALCSVFVHGDYLVVKLTYVGIGDRHSTVGLFDRLKPDVLRIRAMQALCAPMGADDSALEIAIGGLETAAFHYTRRPHYFDHTRIERQFGRNYYPGLGERSDAIAAFEALSGYWNCLRGWQRDCRPFGRDWRALDIAKQCLETTAYHFTRRGGFYGAKCDSAGPVRPWT